MKHRPSALAVFAATILAAIMASSGAYAGATGTDAAPAAVTAPLYRAIRTQLSASRVPVYLPVPIPQAAGSIHSVTVISADAHGYYVGFSALADCAGALSCASFHVAGMPRDRRGAALLAGERAVRLADGTAGAYRPRDCTGASCTEASLRFDRGAFAYEIDVKAGTDALRILEQIYEHLELVHAESLRTLNRARVSSEDEQPPIRVLWAEESAICYVDQRFLPDRIVVARAAGSADAIAAIAANAVTGTRNIRSLRALAIAFDRAHARHADLRSHLSQLDAMQPGDFGWNDELRRIAASPPDEARDRARRIHDEECAVDRAIASHLAALLNDEGAVMTLGATGAFATGGFGTAAGAIVLAHRCGRAVQAYVAETRPHSTGERLTAVELRAAGVRCTVFADAAAAALMHAFPFTAVVAGAEAIAPNGDVIAELGTRSIAIAAAHHRVPLYIAAPRSSVLGRTAAPGALGLNAVALGRRPPDAPGASFDSVLAALRYDVTPGNVIAAIVTEYGVSRPPYDESLAALATRPNFAAIARPSPA